METPELIKNLKSEARYFRGRKQHYYANFLELAAARLEGSPSNDEPLAVDPNVQAVIEQMRTRAQTGLKKYGVTTYENPLTLKQWLQHALEETMDQAVYLQAAIEQIERDERGA